MLSPADTKATEEVTPSGSVYYIREPNGALVARVAGGSARYYHFDALGSTRLLTDASGTVSDTYTYHACNEGPVILRPSRFPPGASGARR